MSGSFARGIQQMKPRPSYPKQIKPKTGFFFCPPFKTHQNATQQVRAIPATNRLRDFLFSKLRQS